MRKEVIIAIFLGGILGSILVYGIYTANKAASQAIENQDDKTENPLEEPDSGEILTIFSPQDGNIYDTSTATISGRTTNDNALIVLTEDDQILPETDSDGNFVVTVDLIQGGNLIQISAITPTGQRQEAFLNLVYTSVPEETDK